MSENPWLAINAANVAWHEQYGEFGQFWPEGKRIEVIVIASTRCKQGQHERCGRLVMAAGLGKAAWPSCECGCHEAAA